MPHTPQTNTERRKENEERIRGYLTKAAGPPPRTSLCSKHMVKATSICTSQNDPYLTHAGKWRGWASYMAIIRFTLSAHTVNLVPNLWSILFLRAYSRYPRSSSG